MFNTTTIHDIPDIPDEPLPRRAGLTSRMRGPLAKTLLCTQMLIWSGTSLGLASDNNTTSLEAAADPYRWMETEKKPLEEWLLHRSDSSRNSLNALPWRAAIASRIEQISNAETRVTSITVQPDRRFYVKTTADHPYGRLFVKEAGSAEQLVIDPPSQTGLAYYEASPSGRYIAYGLSVNGSEITTLRVYDLKSQKELPDHIPRVRYPDINWQIDETSFFYSRLPEENDALPDSAQLSGERIYLHQIGRDPASDAVVFGSGLPALPEAGANDHAFIGGTSTSQWTLAGLSSGTGGSAFSGYVVKTRQIRGERTPWKKIFDRNYDKVTDAILVDDDLYLAATNDHSGYSITRRNIGRPDKPDEKVLEWSDGDLTSFSRSKDSLFVGYAQAGQSRFVRLAFDDVQTVHDIKLPFAGTVGPVFSNEATSGIMFRLQNWTESPRIFQYDPAREISIDSQIIDLSPYDFSSYVAEEAVVRARDGALVPLTIIHKRGMVLASKARTWLVGYGAYGESNDPSFDPSRLVWLEKGGIIAIAHVRGGGELGPRWHEAGMMSRKVNTVYDFIDCAEYLVKQGYTSSQQLVASGASAGGIMVGMAVAMRPNLFAAVSIDSGMLNALRFGEIPIGPANEREFGSITTLEGYKSLRAIDAYASLQSGVTYPTFLLSVGLNDNRVSPWQTAKFVARLLDINRQVSHPKPALIVAEPNAGHSTFTNEQGNSHLADVISFFIWQTQ